jgi:DNA-binding FadR family transcriptional regulator
VFPVGERGLAVKVHDDIAEAIISGDGQLAELLMSRHLKAVNERTIADWPGLLNSTIEWF